MDNFDEKEGRIYEAVALNGTISEPCGITYFAVEFNGRIYPLFSEGLGEERKSMSLEKFEELVSSRYVTKLPSKVEVREGHHALFVDKELLGLIGEVRKEMQFIQLGGESYYHIFIDDEKLLDEKSSEFGEKLMQMFDESFKKLCQSLDESPEDKDRILDFLKNLDDKMRYCVKLGTPMDYQAKLRQAALWRKLGADCERIYEFGVKRFFQKTREEFEKDVAGYI